METQMKPGSMASPAERNREILADLVYEMEQFSTEELLQELQKHSADGTLTIDGGQTAGEYLEELKDLGAICGSHSRWHVIRYHPLSTTSYHPISEDSGASTER